MTLKKLPLAIQTFTKSGSCVKASSELVKVFVSHETNKTQVRSDVGIMPKSGY